MKNKQKAIRGLLICAMALVLSGVTLNKVFASYAQIKVEHIWQDNGNKTDGQWDPTLNAGLEKPVEGEEGTEPSKPAEGEEGTEPSKPAEGEEGTEPSKPAEGGEGTEPSEPAEGGEDQDTEKAPDNLIEKIEHSYTNDSLKESLGSLTITADMSGEDIGSQVSEKLTDTVMNEVIAQLQEQLGLLKELKDMIPEGSEPVDDPGDLESWRKTHDFEEQYVQSTYDEAKLKYEEYQKSAAGQFERLSSKMEKDVVTQLVALLGEEGISRDDMDPEFLAKLNESISLDKIKEMLSDVFSNPENYYTAQAPTEGEDTVKKSLDEVTADLTEKLDAINLGDKLNNETVEGIVTSVIQEIAERANKDADNVKNMDLQLGKLDVVNAQSSGWVSIEDLQKDANILKMSDESEKMLKEQGYKTSLRIEIIVVEQHTENGNWTKEGTYKKTFYSLDEGKTWILKEAVDANGNPLDLDVAIGSSLTADQVTGDGEGVSQYLYTYLHVRAPEKPDDGDDDDGGKEETPDPDPDPEEDIPEPETPLEEPPEEIDEPDIPLADIPETGDISDLWYGAALVLAAGLAVLLYQERRSKKTA